MNDRANDRTSSRLRQRLPFTLSDAGILIWIAAIGLFLSLASPQFFAKANFVNILSQSAVIGILSVGMTLVIISGNDGIDLSVGSIVGISSVTMALVLFPDDAAGIVGAADLLLAAGIALAVGALCGVINGIMIAYVGLPPFIATLAMMTAARGVAAFVSSGRPTYGLPPAIVFLGQGRLFGIPFPVVIMVMLALAVFVVLRVTTFGMRIYAIGGNIRTAFLSGIQVKKIQLAIYTLNGLIAGIAAIVLSGRVNQAHPEAGMTYEMYTIGAVVIGGTSLMGGKGGVIGSVFGAILMAEVQNGINLLDIPVAFMRPILGILIITAVVIDQWQKRRNSGD